MLYAQINNNTVVNIIVLNNASQISTFSAGFQYFVQIDQLVPEPEIGWTYDGNIFSPSLIQGTTPMQIAIASIQAASDFGESIIVQFAAQNALAGITQAGQTQAVINYTLNLSQCLYTGSLYAAIDALNVMLQDNSPTKQALAPFVTNDVIYTYLNAIQSYLEIPLSVNPGP
jgi:hypothetical protein